MNIETGFVCENSDPLEKDIFLNCSCHSEGIQILKFEDEEEFYISLWRSGINPQKPSLRTRLKFCFYTLFGAGVSHDEVVLDSKNVKKLITWVNAHQQKDSCKQRKKEKDLAVRPRDERRAQQYGPEYV